MAAFSGASKTREFVVEDASGPPASQTCPALVRNEQPRCAVPAATLRWEGCVEEPHDEMINEM